MQDGFEIREANIDAQCKHCLLASVNGIRQRRAELKKTTETKTKEYN